jgi:erythromycin esterase-like protein
MTDEPFDGPRDGDEARIPTDAHRAERFLELVEKISAQNAARRLEMTERYFRRMVLREAEQQLIYEEYFEQLGADAPRETPRG